MYEIKLAYYRGKNIISKTIQLFTGKYNHVEMVFPSEVYTLNCFSSSGYDGGVRYKRIKFSHPERWYFQSLGNFELSKIGELRSYCDKYIGKKYATLDVIRRFGLGKKVNDPNKFWCSEVCIRALNDWKFFTPKMSENLAPTRMIYRIERWLKNAK